MSEDQGNSSDRFDVPDEFGTMLVRFNGVASAKGSDVNGAVGTSCSVFAPSSGSIRGKGSLYHLLIDIGAGAVKSLEEGVQHVNAREENLHSNAIPDAVLVSHGHLDHIADLPHLARTLNDSSMQGRKIQIYCTKQCQDEILKACPTLFGADSALQFSTLNPGEKVTIGPFDVLALKGDHNSDEEKAESLIFIISRGNTKIVTGWDFRALVDADEGLFWNPALLILGTESFNPHPSMTGMISVSDAFNLARRWNAKEVFLLHYSGMADLEDGKNQWFMGPTKPMSLDELQNTVDKTLRITGVEGKFRITVAKQGMIWSSKEYFDRIREYYAGTEEHSDESDRATVGPHLEIEALDKYLLKFDSLHEGDKLRVTVEDKIRSFEPEFESPIRNAEGTLLKAHAIRGMLAKGPDIAMKVVEKADGENAFLELTVSKGKKSVFHDTIPVRKRDAARLAKYITENFKVSSQPLVA